MENRIHSILNKISDGFFESIGAAIAVAIGTFIGSYFGGQQASKEVLEEVSKRDTTYVVNKFNNYDKARMYELNGFEALLNRNINDAIDFFMASENMYNGYHASYEICQYLRNNKTSVKKNDFWKETYLYIIEKHYYYIPSDVRQKMEDYIKKN